MSTPIKDGTGKGFLGKVDQRNDFHVKARTNTVAHARTIEGAYFSASSQLVPITANPRRIFHYTYSEPIKNLAIQRMTVGWNGGSTSFNCPAYFSIFAGETAPTTNIIQSVTINQNFGSKTTLSGTLLIWDGVGDGMDGYVPGAIADTNVIGPGSTTFDYNGDFIISPGSIFGIAAWAEEDGMFIININGFTLEPDIDY